MTGTRTHLGNPDYIDLACLMARKVNTCLYIDKPVLETAKRSGLNLSRVSENALLDAIRRLRDA